ncbi:ABC transporter ATP-binding protein [Spiroplasma phoeniceum]|uniref:ABC-type transport system ATP-binding protein n=1 Tax=Spiroplasma phoeniceum P40 TaxID=1276259 RepID=A0A345DQ45_9MOLU|nr:ABC transporter ATP-binding protein [Spiroplasma phoeniceum]AXF96333.1 ABC-type transport system ATP-binding protein [Spiroplasma phoeniceum P40]
MNNNALVLSDVAIASRNFSKKFKNSIVGPFNFNVSRGKLHAILGASGSGKTVFIKSLIGGLKGFNGDITIFGKKATKISMKKMIGYVPEFVTFPENISSYNFLKYLGKTNGLRGKYLRDRIEYLMKSLEIWEHRDKDVNSFSSGMKKRVMIIQGIIHDPEILILDEPEAGLDINNRKKIIFYLKQLTLRGKTVFFSSHLLDEIKDYIDEFTMVMNGTQIYTGQLAAFNIKNSYYLVTNNPQAMIRYFNSNRVLNWYDRANNSLNFVLNSPLHLYYVTQYALKKQIKIAKISEVEFSFDFLLQKLNITLPPNMTTNRKLRNKQLKK